MANSKKVKAVSFSKWRAIYYFAFFIIALGLIINAISQKGLFPKQTLLEYMLTLALVWACYCVLSWFPHMYQVVTTNNPSVYIEGDKIIAFDKVFPKGPHDHILFEKRRGKLGLWATLRNGDEATYIPFMFKRHIVDYVEPQKIIE